MKKSIKNTIISLALSAAGFCFLGGAMPFISKANAVATPAYYTLDGFTIEESAAVRTREFNGIRFTTNLSAETLATVNSRLTNAKYGTLLIPADMLGVEELTHETAEVVVSPAEIWRDEDTYTAVLAGGKDANGNYTSLPDSYYNRPIAARSYVTGKDSAGKTVTYYSENTAVRSIGYVATMAKLDGNTSSFLSDIAEDSKVELVFDANKHISAVQNSAEGTTIIENKYNVSSDAPAVIMVGGIPISMEYMAKYGATISYTSSATDVISVSGQTLTANKIGEATITATTTFNGKTYTATKTLSTGLYKGQSEYKILISEAAANCLINSQTNYTPAATLAENDAYYNAFEKTAAYKLQSILEEATGLRLEIVTAVEPGCKYISIGETALGSATKLAAETLEKDTASEIKVDDNGNIIICGTKQQGTLYGVQNLLKELVGYNYFMENTYVVDSNIEVVLDADKQYIPDIEYNVLQGDLEREGVADDFTMQMYPERIVPLATTNEEDTKGYYYRGVAHNSVWVLDDGTYDSQTSVSTVSAAWKNWYATNKRGTTYKTITNPEYTGTDKDFTAINEAVQTIKAELCYTAHGSADVRNTMIAQIVEQILVKMERYPAYERIGFAHMDHRIWCECTSCSKAGNPSDNLLEFLLDVAAELKNQLTQKGDARAETFKIVSLFYHKTNENPKNTVNYISKLQGYMKHVEPWFAESGADHVDPYYLTDEQKDEIANNNCEISFGSYKSGKNNWNSTVYTYLQNWSSLCNTYGADLFLWVYYSNTTSFFIPYNTFNAIRVNYGTFADFGVDYVFNQMMESKQDWARFKEFIISKLIWNAHPTDAEWEAWYVEYFQGAYGQGAEGMREYFDAWDEWTTDNANEYRRDNDYDATSSTDASISKDIRELEDELTATVLEGWIDSIDKALAALDVCDPKYETYRRNIMLEKLTPMYLLMWMHDGYTPVKADGWPPINPNEAGTFKTTTYVNKYGAEFLTWVNEWNISMDGEGSRRVLKPFVMAIQNAGVNGGEVISNKVITEKQYATIGSAVSFTNSAFTDGTYTVSGAISDTITVAAGVATLNTSALTAGQTYTLVFTSESGATIRFTNVVAATKLSASDSAVSGRNGYYYIDKTYYVEEGKTQLVINHNLFTKGDYTISVDEQSNRTSIFIEGKVTVALGKLVNGQSCEVICVDENSNTYIFKVICAKFIRTAEELKALGIGGNRGSTANIDGYYALANDITFEHKADYSDLVAAGYPSGDTGKFAFKGTFDGCGYTLYNMRVSDGGIFGIMDGTIKNLNLKNVYLTENPPANTTNQNGAYIAILAFSTSNGVFENIDISLKYAPSKWTWRRDGLFVCTGSRGAGTFRNITVDASGLQLNTLLGISYNSNNVYQNVVIKATSYVAVAYSGDSYNPNGGVQNTAALMSEFPAGVTFEYANSMVAQNAAYLDDYVLYDGDVTALGFAEGTRVLKAGIDPSVWDNAYASRAKLGYIDTNYDYVDIQLSLNKSCSFVMWDGVSTSYNVTATSVNPNPAANTRTIQFLDANGNAVTSFAANTVYTLRVYIKATNGDVLKNFQLTTATAGAVIYFGNVTFGNNA